MPGQSDDIREITVIDMGGTHARFAIATLDPGGALSLGAVTTLRVADHADPLSAWSAYRAQTGGRPPRNVALAVAAMTNTDTIDFPNSPWTLSRATLEADLECERVVILNDFEAVAHAAARARSDQFLTLAGPDTALPSSGAISVIGPGTGLGVASFHCEPSGRVRVQATEGSHGSFGPVDALEDALLARLRARFGRVSNERVAAGPAILDIYAVLADADGERAALGDAVAIWEAGLSGQDALAAQAVERFCLILGSVAGDIALAQGAGGVVIAGGLGYRMREALVRSGFAQRFAAKGRYTDYMKTLPVKIMDEAQPGLIGAAAAFAATQA